LSLPHSIAASIGSSNFFSFFDSAFGNYLISILNEKKTKPTNPYLHAQRIIATAKHSIIVCTYIVDKIPQSILGRRQQWQQ
jgi:hypothetical protein